MKTRNILITLGIILILFNFLSYLGGKNTTPEQDVNKAAYYIGRNIFFIAGIILIVIGYIRHKKIIAKKEKEMIDNFLK